ncbi:MAG TPA: HSP20 family small heat-shock protein [Mycobacterium sp.]|nr:HSP20 family small heat-shock protein [Mycobacterium sp.]
MSNLPTPRRSRSVWPEIAEWFAGFPSWAEARPIFGGHVMRLEDEMTDGHYEVRAELPGIDPEKDVEITVREGRLTIKAERSEKKDAGGRSEFSYGSFVRTVSLPPGADEDHISATYDKGILTVSVPIAKAEPAEKHIQVTSG